MTKTFFELAALDVRKGFLTNLLSGMFAYLTLEKSSYKCGLFLHEIKEPKNLHEVDLIAEMKNI